jgi:excisionase family DNA binding protein
MHVTNVQFNPADVTAAAESREVALARLAYSVAEAAVVSGLSRSKLYELMNGGALSSVKIGSRRLIRHGDLVALLHAQN